MTSYPPPPPAYSSDPQASASEPARGQPWYGAPFGLATKRGFQKYAVFSGRASRSEFWWWTLATSIVVTVISVVAEVFGFPDDDYLGLGGLQGPGDMINLFNSVIQLALVVPGLALTWRRLHDVNRSGRHVLIALIPIVGWVLIIVWLASRSEPAGRRFDIG